MSKKTQTVKILTPEALELIRTKAKSYEDFYNPDGSIRSDVDLRYIRTITSTIDTNSIQEFLDSEKKLQ